MHRCKNARAVDNLLERTSAEELIKQTEELWECWLTHDNSNNVSVTERKQMLYNYKARMKFLQEIS